MVTFPIDGAKYGRPPPGRHGEAWIMIFGATFDKTEMVDETVVEPFLAGMRGAEQWNASDPVSKEMFSFTTMAFPKSLASVFWEDQCRPPPTDAADVHCRAVDMGGAHGREYLVVTKDPTRPGLRSYVVQRIAIRKDRLYLLMYGGEEAANRSESTWPSTPRQRAFLGSLRFLDP